MQNTMLLTDLATNLAAIIARNRGARYTVATNLSAKTPPYVTQAKQRLRAVQNDYNGKIANFYLRGSAPYNDTHIAAAPKFISDVGTKQSDWENSNNKLFTKNR